MEIHVTADGRLIQGAYALPCVLGRSGIVTDKREGDGGTPAGIFALRRVLYRPDRMERPATRLPLAPLSPADGWCDDPEHRDYNRPVQLPFPARHEALWRHDELYDIIVILGFNDDPVVPFAGSAIFLHVCRPDRSPTEGCVAVEKDDLLMLLRRVAPDTVIRIG